MNVLIITGRLTRDSELKSTPTGQLLLKFSVAFESGFGEKKQSMFANCTLWGKRAEAMEKFLIKGCQVAVNGELTVRDYVKADLSKGYSIDLGVNEITLMGGRAETDGPSQGLNKSSPPPRAKAQQTFTPDDIPF